MFLPIIVLGELRKGVDRLDRGTRSTALGLWLLSTVAGAIPPAHPLRG